MTPRKALVLGGESGLLGMSLVTCLRDAGWYASVTARPDKNACGDEDLAALIDLHEPDVVFNTWAYTQVDLAEDEPERARRVNAALPEALGRACKGRDVTLVHYSTDFVFGGSASAPRREDEQPSPESVYGATKLEGERALLALNLPRLVIIRTAWLFGPGKKNFVRTMLDLAATRDELGVVHDQIGSPTYTPDLAAYSLALVDAGATGVFHVVNAGSASWCELAAEALRCAASPCTVNAITSDDYPQKAKRPRYSVLDTTKFSEATGVTPRPWVQAVQEYVFGETAKRCD